METIRSGFVALIGRPNVGKSTLMNHMIGQKIAITANKPQTTRNRIQTVYTDKRGQIVFLDTPGIHKAKNRLGEFMVGEAARTISDADAVLWLVEPSPFIGRNEQSVIDMLMQQTKPVILVINKIDTVDKEAVEKTKEAFRSIMPFKKILTVSALRSVHVTDVLDVLFSCLPEGPMYYDEDTVTDQPMRQIAAEIIREKCIRILQEEVPHGIAVVIDAMKERKDGMFDIEASVVCERESHKGIIIGKGGAMLKRIGSQARTDIENMMEAHVNLKLFVKVKKDWRDSDILMKNFGYHENKD